MKSGNNTGKVAFDMFIVQNTWSAFFLTIVAIVYIVLQIIGGDVEINQQDLSQQSFLTFAYRPSKVYMFIMGVISVSGFLTFYVKQGITRKNYFFGSAIASLVVAFVLMMMSGLITLVEQIFLPIEEVSFMGSDAPWILSVVVLSLNLLVYNMAGWISPLWQKSWDAVYYLCYCVRFDN